MNTRSFTLVELMIVIAIIGVLITLGFGTYINIQRRARDTKRISDINGLVHAIITYEVEQGAYPGDADDLGVHISPDCASDLRNDLLNNGYIIINHPDYVKNSVNKKIMFECFLNSGINALTYISYSQLFKPKNLFKLLTGKLFLRNEYATIKEKKVLEYRIIVFNGKTLKTYIKIPRNKDFILKKANCTFKRIESRFPSHVDINIINSVKCLGLDLAGVDMLVNDKGEFKIIEVNSGPGMGKKTIKQLFKEIKIQTR